MHKIAFISQDPGGTNALVPIIKAMGECCYTTVIAKDNAVDIYERHGIAYINANTLTDQFDKAHLSNILKKYNPRLIVTGTSSTDFYERNMWIAAKELGIASTAILDSWCYYGLRFSSHTFKDMALYRPGEFPCLPDHILVMDDDAKKCMIREGIEENRLEVVGQPFLQELRKSFEDVKQPEISGYKQKLCGDRKKIIVYASDNLSSSFYPDGRTYWGYDEKSTFVDIYNSIQKKCKNFDSYTLIIRPHPKEKNDNWDDIMNQIASEGRDNVVIDRSTREEVLISVADIVIGMWTMLLMEAAIAGKKVLSVQLNAKREAPFVLSEKGLVKPIFCQQELEKTLQMYFSGRTVGEFKWNIGNDSVQRIREHILRTLNDI